MVSKQSYILFIFQQRSGGPLSIVESIHVSTDHYCLLVCFGQGVFPIYLCVLKFE